MNFLSCTTCWKLMDELDIAEFKQRPGSIEILCRGCSGPETRFSDRDFSARGSEASVGGFARSTDPTGRRLDAHRSEPMPGLGSRLFPTQGTLRVGRPELGGLE